MIVEQQLDLIRKPAQVLQHSLILLIPQRAADARELHRQKIHGAELRTVCLGGRDRNLRSRPRVHDMVRLTGNGAPHDIDNTENADPVLLSQAQGGQRIRRLAGLTDHDEHGVLHKNRIAVPEFRGEIRLHRNSGKTLDDIFSRDAGVIGRAAGDNVNLLNLPDILIGQAQLVNDNFSVLDAGRYRVADRLRLLVHLLQHEVIIAALLRRGGVPVNVRLLHRGRLLIDREEFDFVRRQF